MQQLDGAPAPATDLQQLALLGFGHFTTMRVETGGVRGLSLHLDRLVRDCRAVFGADLDRDRVPDLVSRAIADEPDLVLVRVTVFDPDLTLGAPGAPSRPRVLVTPRPPAGAPPSALRVRTTAYARDLPAVKHTGLFGALHARAEAQRAGWDDAVFADGRGWLSEGPTWNLGFVADGRVVWPDAEVLPGVTAELLARDAPGTRAAVTREDLERMSAAFAMNAGFGVRPISAIDDVVFDPDHPALAELDRAYQAIPFEPLAARR
ncbi:aminotransferase class IV [Microbacterium oryzae]|uniref:aminotransferase class IV n=1 Tax=Microbacterium oryzae TaxID=743009 RepID=UPI0025AF8C17|nr:aminotransferase class IV [Microbacterium oryzae]MDN3310770.1 aminotransferase class IV [Microbacterium oryzae]